MCLSQEGKGAEHFVLVSGLLIALNDTGKKSTGMYVLVSYSFVSLIYIYIVW